MKRTLLAAAVASAASSLLVPAAHAQSSVTVFGIVDAGVRRVHNDGVGSLQSLVSGSNNTSRIGLRGVEDLGNGQAASFHLEGGLLLDTGTQASTKLWDRRATVGVSGTSWGEVRLGRDYVPTYTSWTRYDPFSYVGVGRSADFFTGTPTGPVRSVFGTNENTLVRADNSVQYLLPGTLGGIEGGLMYTPSEGGDATAGLARLVGYRLGYGNERFTVSAAMDTVQNSLTTQGKFRDTTLGGSVKTGPVNVAAAWRQLKYTSGRQVNLMLSAVGTFGPHVVKASWIRADLKGTVGAADISANDGRKFALGYQYNLSKRTALYATLARISNDGAARFNIPGGPAGLVAGGTSSGYEAGMRHNF